MGADDILRSVGLDRYDINARLKPALLVLLPVFLTVAFWIPQARTVVGGIISLLSACGLLYLMTQTARRMGRSVERRMEDRAGRKHSARLLTHADKTIASETKKRYHAYLRSHGLSISTPEEELASPETAFDRTRSAIDWLLEHTRPNAQKSLLFTENIAYGYQRNLFGLKPIALIIAFTAIAGHGLLLWIRPLDETTLWIGLLIGVGLAATIFLWALIVTQASVVDASLSYAQQLFNQCETSATGPVKKTRGKALRPDNIQV